MIKSELTSLQYLYFGNFFCCFFSFFCYFLYIKLQTDDEARKDDGLSHRNQQLARC